MTPTSPIPPRRPPVAVIGMSCRLPAAANLDEFRQATDRDAAYAPAAGHHIDGVDLFDSAWFGIPEAEAAVLDPRRRLALEAVVEAIDDAGIGYRTRGSGAAVVVAVGPAPRYGRGRSNDDIAHGVSHTLDLHGPSSTLEITDGQPRWAEAVSRVFEDESVPFVIVVGVDVEADGTANAEGRKGNSGARPPHDESVGGPASGIAWQVGCGALVLQRLADAVRTGSRLHAEIDLTTSDFPLPDARSDTAPCASGSSGVEVSAQRGRTLVGDVSAVSGSRYATAGSISLSEKEALAETSSSTGRAQLSPTIGSLPATRSVMTVVERVCAFTADTAQPSAAPIEPTASESHSTIDVRATHIGRSVRPANPPVLITVTGRDGAEFRNAAMRLVHHLRYAAPEDDRAGELAALHELSAATTRLIPKAMRGAVLAENAAAARDRLRALAEGEAGPGVVGPRTPRRRDRVLFLFNGTAERPAKLGRALAARYPMFAAALNEITDAVVAAGGPRIWTPRFGFHPPPTGCAERELGLLAGFTHQVALARLVESWGVRPDAVCGYGFAELAAGLVAGVLTTADAARLAVWRARAAAAEPRDERAAALVGATPDEVARLIEPMRPAVTIAAIHGPRAVLVRGEPRQLEAIARRGQRRDLPVTILDRSEGDDAERGLVSGDPLTRPGQLGLGAPRLPFYSTTRAGLVFSTGAPDAHYWTEDVHGVVQLSAAMERAAHDGVGTVLEFAAHAALTPGLRDHPEFLDSVHPVGDRDDEVGALLLALAELHADGRFVEWSGQGPFTGAGPRRRWRRTPVRSPLPLITDCATATVEAGDTGEHTLGAIALVPTGYWVRTLLRLAGPAEMMTDFLVHDRLGPDALGAIEYRDDGPAGLRAYLDDVPMVSARPLTGPAPADIVDWMRVVDTGRSARHRMRELGGANFYAMLRGHRLEYSPHRRVLGRLETGAGHAFGTVEPVAANLVSIIEGCLHLLVAAAPEFVSDRTYPSVPAISAVWVGAGAERLITGAHATVRERGPDTLVGDVVGTDDEGVPVLALAGVRIVFAERDAAAGEGQAAIAPFRTQVWLPATTGTDGAPQPRLRRLLVVGATETAARLARATDLTVTTEHVARAPDAAGDAVWAAAAAGDPPTGIVLIWPDGDDPDPAAALARAHGVLTRAGTAAGTAGLTVVLPRRALHGNGGAATAWGVAALVRTLRLESRRRIRIVWADTDPRALGLLADLVTIDAPDNRRARTPAAGMPDTEARESTGEPGSGTSAPSAPLPDLSTPGRSAPPEVTPDQPAASQFSANGSKTAEPGPGPVVDSAPEPDRSAPSDPVPSRPTAGTAPHPPTAGTVPCRPTASDSVPSGSVSSGSVPSELEASELEAGDVLWAGDLRVGADGLAVRRFRAAPAVASPAPRIDPGGTYVVTGGLGRRGAIAVRWLLDAGAHDVVVLTRDPRPVPGPLDGLEDRFVVVRCDVADRTELAGALDDIREYGSTIRGVVHAAEDFEPAGFGAVTADQLARLFAPKAEAARYLLELTAGDPIDFVLLFSSAAGALGARNQAAYAAASAAVDALAAGSRRRRVLALGWEIRRDDDGAGTDDDPARVARGAHVLTQALRSGAPHLLVGEEIGSFGESPATTVPHIR